MTPHEFVDKWKSTALKERAAAQEHFLDLCALVSHPTPAQDDPTGQRFAFEAGATKQTGGQGWADVWKKGYFAWEYKGKHADLDKAYQQLLLYRESLQNPPLLIVGDLNNIIIHTNFTNTIKRTVTITLDALLTSQGMRDLRAIFYEPDFFRAPETTEQVTQEAARQFARLAEYLHKRGDEPARIAHFLIRLLFCLFAEDIDLLPKALFTRLVDQGRSKPLAFTQQLRQLFGAMATGGFFGEHAIMHFNGGLFDSEDVLELDRNGLDILYGVTMLDWSNIEPSILGTLFERSLNPSKRAQLGAHYTSKDDILLIIEPVLMVPLRRRWEEVKTKAWELAQRRDDTKDQGTRTRRQNELDSSLSSFADEIASVRVLDPACGSGNFLYVALKQLLDLGKIVNQFTAEVKASQLFPQANPAQLYGIEINEYAHELAQSTVWIGYIQWLHDNGYGTPSEPILKPLDNIKHMDAILAYDLQSKPVEPAWPEADVVIGNPPFLGDKKMRGELGSKYVTDLRTLYQNYIPGGADLVTYWFWRAFALIQAKKIQRTGLIATQSIRVGANRHVLDHIKKTGDIFMAWSDRPWVLDGAQVRVSIVGFDSGKESERSLNGHKTFVINSNLSSTADVTQAILLLENSNIAFIGTQKGGLFEIPSDVAEKMISLAGNPNGRPSTDVIRPWINGYDITGRPRNMWIIDFPSDISEAEAALYEIPFEYIRKNVRPDRDQNIVTAAREKWWVHARSRPAMRIAWASLKRYIVTPRVAKHRIFVYIPMGIIPDSRLTVITREDDYFLGVLHSRIHEFWSLSTSPRHGVGNDPTYNAQSCFETFPFPWPPGHESQDGPRVQAIAQAAKELVEKRDAWLNPPGLGDKELQKRTLTNLYNARPTWLDMAHKKLDAAVFAAYDWPTTLSDEEVLIRLLALNLERAGRR
ncbi:class I SAM-dependent DNA methyltransferase [soil metagenome]